MFQLMVSGIAAAVIVAVAWRASPRPALCPRDAAETPTARRRRAPGGIEVDWKLALVLGAGVVGIVGPTAAVGVCGAAAVGRWSILRLRRVRAARAVDDATVDLIEMFVVAASAGQSVTSALRSVAAVAPLPLHAPMGFAVAQLERGATTREVLAGLSAALGPSSFQLVDALGRSSTTGAALLPALTDAAARAREQRRQSATERVRRLPVSMLFPLVGCVLPAAIVVAVVPVLVVSLASLSQ